MSIEKSKKVEVEHGQTKSQKKAASLKTKSTKKISLRKIVQKTVEILKKPFERQEDHVEVAALATAKPKARSRRKKESITVDYPETSLKKLEKAKERKTTATSGKKKIGKQIKQEKPIIVESEFQDDDQLEDAEERQKQTASQISTEVNGFFYTNDKFITRFEDDDILKYLKEHYPLFMKDPLDFQIQKKQILDMLQNVQFMEQFLSYYDMNIYEFFKFLFRLEPDLFKGSFLKRVQKAMRYKKYAIQAKRCSFVERRRARLKNLKQGAI